MCIAIYKAPGAKITDEQLQASVDRNRDGCGFAGITDSEEHERKLYVYKCLKYNKFLKKFRKFEEENPESPMLIHFRIATHGLVDGNNCHPFKVSKDAVFIHNGTIHKAPIDPDRLKSDTRMFNETVLQNLPKGWERSSGIKEMIEEYIGFSKIAVLSLNGTVTLYRELETGAHWNTDKNIWFSNTSYKPPVKTTQHPAYQHPKTHKKQINYTQPHNQFGSLIRSVGNVEDNYNHFNTNFQCWLQWDFDYECWRKGNSMGGLIYDSDFLEYKKRVDKAFDPFLGNGTEDTHSKKNNVLTLDDYDTCDLCSQTKHIDDMVLVSTDKRDETYLLCQTCLDAQHRRGVYYANYMYLSEMNKEHLTQH